METDMDRFLARLGCTLRNRRREHGLTLTGLSERTGLSVSHLSGIERGVVSPSFKALERLADVYGLEVLLVFKRKKHG